MLYSSIAISCAAIFYAVRRVLRNRREREEAERRERQREEELMMPLMGAKRKKGRSGGKSDAA